MLASDGAANESSKFKVHSEKTFGGIPQINVNDVCSAAVEKDFAKLTIEVRNCDEDVA